MTWTISIAAAITVAVTARLMYLLFLSGKHITTASVFGRFVSRISPAVKAFADGWREQTVRYRLIAYPCMIATMGLVSALLYWMMPAMGNSTGVGDMVRYGLLVFGVGVSLSLVMSLALIFLVYFVISLVGGWWRPEATGAGEGEKEIVLLRPIDPPRPSADKTGEGAKPKEVALESEAGDSARDDG